MTFRNQSSLTFTDISSEAERIYTFPNGRTYRVANPEQLHVSDSGGHRLFDGTYCYYIQPKEGWVIRWLVKDGQPHFVK